MSKVFELVQQVETERGLAPVAAMPSNGHRPRKNAVDQEEISRLVQRLFRSADGTAPRAVVFAGVERGVGCSSICAATAEGLAAMGTGTICVVDGNLRNPLVHEYFGITPQTGLAEALTQTGPLQNFVQRVNGRNIWVMPSGSAIANASGFLSSDAMPSRMAELRNAFDHILIDTPALTQSGDAIVLGGLSDGMLLVVESNSTRRETARNVIANVKDANVRLLGAVLNKRTFPIPQDLYARL